MEVKLTTDWILSTDTELIYRDGKCCVISNGSSFHYHLIELAFKTLGIKYDVEELFEDDDTNYEKPNYYWYFDNIEDVKNTCPNLYQEFKKLLKQDDDWQESIKRRESLILEFLNTKKTAVEIQKFLLSKKEDTNHITHIEYLLERLKNGGLIFKTKNAKSKKDEFIRKGIK